MRPSFTTTGVLLLVCAVLAGCNTAARQRYAQQQAHLQAQANATKKVEVFYAPENFFGVFDGGGSSWLPVAAFLGPVGAVTALVAYGISVASVEDRANSRGHIFTDKVKTEIPNLRLSQDVADAVASELRASGREVLVTSLRANPGTADLSNVPELSAVAKGHAGVVLRLRAGFSAADVTSPYIAGVALDFYCQDESGSKMFAGTAGRRGKWFSPYSFQGLLEKSSDGYLDLKKMALEVPSEVIDNCFPVAEAAE